MPHRTEVTPAGYPERRRVQYVTWDQMRRQLILIGIGYLLLMVASSVGIYWAWKNSQSLKRNGSDAILRSCESRADLRLTTAQAIDQLRLVALTKPTSKEQEQAQHEFIVRTQQPVDKLISQAAGRPVHTNPPGPIPPSVTAKVRREAAARCEKQAADFRGKDAPAGTE